MNYVVAVSGGVDSVVLLDMLVHKSIVIPQKLTSRGSTSGAKPTLVIAHFDHGIREDSASDARFVAQLAARHNLTFETKCEELGPKASEAVARDRRYAFLQSVAKKYHGVILTAHHLDDLVETIAINLVRGTGWRGLAVFGNTAIVRPLVTKQKSELYDYALKNNLEWVEDSTNQQGLYLRNRLRATLRRNVSAKDKRQLEKLWRRQTNVRKRIASEANQILNATNHTSRYFFTQIDEPCALELLRASSKVIGSNLTLPQLRVLLRAIKTARAGSQLEAGNQVHASFTSREFIVKNHL